MVETKEAIMFFRTTTSKENSYLQLVQAYRNEENKPTHRVVANLGNISHLDEQKRKKLAKSFIHAIGLKAIVSLDEIRTKQTYDYGDILPVIGIWHKLKLFDIIRESISERVDIPVDWITLILVANRFCDPQSKLGAYHWMDRSLFGLLGELFPNKKEEEKLHMFYRSLDYLVSAKESIEERLYYQLKTKQGLEVSLVFYDVTSSYFEGTDAQIGEYGYSRDHRPDRTQIVIGLVCDRHGIPFAHYVFRGNTQDKATVKGIISSLKERFNIKECIFVADRGMVTKVNLEHVINNGFNYIAGLKKHRSPLIRELIKHVNDEQIKEIKLDDIEDKKLKKTLPPNVRFIVCLNKDIAEKTFDNRQKRISKLKSFIESQKLSGQLAEITETKTKIDLFIKEQSLKRYYKTKVEKEEGIYKLIIKEDKVALDLENKLDGRFFIQTEDEGLAKEEIVFSYKHLQKVEHAFRVIKNNIDLRPIYVRLEDRIRGHVFICFLAYLVEALLEKYINQELSESVEEIKKQMNGIKILPFDFNDLGTRQEETFYLVSHISQAVRKIYSEFGVINAANPSRLRFKYEKKRSSHNLMVQLSLF